MQSPKSFSARCAKASWLWLFMQARGLSPLLRLFKVAIVGNLFLPDELILRREVPQY